MLRVDVREIVRADNGSPAEVPASDKALSPEGQLARRQPHEP